MCFFRKQNLKQRPYLDNFNLVMRAFVLSFLFEHGMYLVLYIFNKKQPDRIIRYASWIDWISERSEKDFFPTAPPLVALQNDCHNDLKTSLSSTSCDSFRIKTLLENCFVIQTSVTKKTVFKPYRYITIIINVNIASESFPVFVLKNWRLDFSTKLQIPQWLVVKNTKIWWKRRWIMINIWFLFENVNFTRLLLTRNFTSKIG